MCPHEFASMRIVLEEGRLDRPALSADDGLDRIYLIEIITKCNSVNLVCLEINTARLLSKRCEQ
jgi:hypothetical protein